MHQNLSIEMNHRAIFALSFFSRAASIAVALLGGLVLVGWALDIVLFKSILPDHAAMKPNAAVAFVLAGLTLWLLKSEQANLVERRVAMLCAAMIITIAVATLGEYILKVEFGIDHVLFRDVSPSLPDRAHPGRMSQITATSFLGLGVALLFFDSPRYRLVSFILTVIVHLMSIIALVGYLYGAQALYAVGPFDTISLPTAVSFALISAGALSARPQRGFMGIIASITPGGIMVRHILPLALTAPIILGWLRLVGQEAGLYNTAFGISILVVSLIVIFTFVILRSGRSLMVLDEQRMQAKRILVAHEKRFRAMIENNDDIITLTNPDCTRVYTSPAVTRILGYPIEEYVGRTSLDFIHLDDRERILHVYQELVNQPEKSITVRYRHRHKDGSWRWIEGTAKNMIAEPSVQAIIENFRDITERVQAEDKLRRNQAHLLASQRIAHLGSWELELTNQDDVNENHLYWSDEVFRIFGYEPGQIDVSNENFFRSVHPEDRAAIQTAISRAIETQSQFNIEHRIIRPDGDERIVHEQSEILCDEKTGQPLKMIGTVQDVTDRLLAENALRESEERFSAFMAHSPVLTWIKDDRFRHVFVNAAFEKTFNLSHDMMRGKTDFDFIPEEIAKEIRAHDMQVMTSGQPMQTVEVVTIPDGAHHQLLVSKFVFRARDGRMFLGGIGSDITKLKQTEEALAHHVKELARSNAELQQFAYVASHDLQEPLRMVSSYLQLLERRYKGKLDTDADEFIGYAVEGARRMKGLIEDLLSYSRVGEENRRLDLTSSDAALKRALENLQYSVNECGLRLTQGPLPALKADGSQLVQLFQNLIGNALKFKSEKLPEVHIAAELKNGEWLFSVRDNGIGIDPKYIDRIFEIFKRLHGRNLYPGNGIGLAICKKIVERHGGRIWAESQLGDGATFYFTIPSVENYENGHSGKALHEHISYGQTS